MNADIKIYREGCGQALTLIHGWGMNAAVFEPLLASLVDDFCVTRIDLPGYGQSSWLGENFDQQVEQIAQALDDSIVLGWSLGGLYALRLAHRYPERFHRLILMNSNPCFVQRENWHCAVDAEVFRQFGESLGAGWQATVRRFLGLQMQGIEQARQRVRELTALLEKGGEPDPQALDFGLQCLLEQDLRSHLGELSQPVLCLLGERDTLVPACVGEQIHRISEAIGVECVARSAHAPFLSHRDTVVRLIREFAQPATP